MNFKKIIIAAIEEEGGTSGTDTFGPWGRRWRDGEKLNLYFYDYMPEVAYCSFYWGDDDKFLFRIYETDLLDPNWSPATLAKQIDGGIARLKNDL